MNIIDKRPRGLIKDFIWVKDDTLSESFCEHVIQKFDNDPRKNDGIIGSLHQRVDKSVKDVKDITITRESDWSDEDAVFFKSLEKGLEEYSDYLYEINKGVCNSFPNPLFLTHDTGYKVQKYEPISGHYNWHHDWSMTVDPVASRVFTFMWYLNTIDEKDDGYTEFADGTRIQPERGKLVLFPATWTFLHRGYPPKVKKYTCNGWIHCRPDYSNIKV